jgi:integrase
MPEKRTRVWVQHFADREYLMLQWHDPVTGKRRSKSAQTNNPVTAEDKRADLEADLNAGRHVEASGTSWGRFRQLFEAEFVAGRRANTRRNYRVALDLFEKVCAPRLLRGVNERTLSAFAAGLRRLPGHGGTTMKESTVEVRLQFLHTALQWAVDQKLLPALPKFPAVKPPKKRPQPVPTESVEKVLDKAPDAQTGAFLLCGWLAGLRLNEALALEWGPSDRAPYLDVAHDRIVFPAEVVKGCEDQWVPLDPDLWAALDALPRVGPKVFNFDAIDGRGDGELTAGAVSYRVTQLAAAAGVRLTMKTLRRGFGCRYAARVPAQVLQRLMRHANIRTTMEYYANVDDAAMDAVLGPRRNRIRNKPAEPAAENNKADDAKPCQERPAE